MPNEDKPELEPKTFSTKARNGDVAVEKIALKHFPDDSLYQYTFKPFTEPEYVALAKQQIITNVPLYQSKKN